MHTSTIVNEWTLYEGWNPANYKIFTPSWRGVDRSPFTFLPNVQFPVKSIQMYWWFPFNTPWLSAMTTWLTLVDNWIFCDWNIVCSLPLSKCRQFLFVCTNRCGYGWVNIKKNCGRSIFVPVPNLACGNCRWLAQTRNSRKHQKSYATVVVCSDSSMDFNSSTNLGKLFSGGTLASTFFTSTELAACQREKCLAQCYEFQDWSAHLSFVMATHLEYLAASKLGKEYTHNRQILLQNIQTVYRQKPNLHILITR